MNSQLIIMLQNHIENSHKIKETIQSNLDYHIKIAKMRNMDSATDILDMTLFAINKTADDLIIKDEHELIDLIYSKMDWLG